MMVGVPSETAAGERRVALVPADVPALTKAGFEVQLQKGAGIAAGFPDERYEEKGARVVDGPRAAVIASSDVLLSVRSAAADPGQAIDSGSLKEGQLLIGFLEPYAPHDSFTAFRDAGVTAVAMELLPRITRAQSMDALSSMANLAGYRAVILAAARLAKIFPMMMTAAGTIVPAKVLIVGAGVAGLQAIATARRLGAVVSAYDVRPAVREQVASLGGKFVEIELDTENAEGSGGYAAAMDEAFYRKQRELMHTVVADSDIVITTAAIPGKPSPVLVTEPMVTAMRPGSVIVDLAAQRGGNVELSRLGEEVDAAGVAILAPENIVSGVAHDASRLYSRNITTLLLSFVTEGDLAIDLEDEIAAAAVVTHGGEVPNADLQERLFS